MSRADHDARVERDNARLAEIVRYLTRTVPHVVVFERLEHGEIRQCFTWPGEDLIAWLSELAERRAALAVVEAPALTKEQSRTIRHAMLVGRQTNV